MMPSNVTREPQEARSLQGNSSETCPGRRTTDDEHGAGARSKAVVGLMAACTLPKFCGAHQLMEFVYEMGDAQRS